MPESLSLSVKITYGLGHIFNDFCASMWFTYLLLFFNDVVKLNSGDSSYVSYGGIALAVGQLADAISTQFVGVLSDRSSNHWLCKYGRRKTWHLMGTVCTCISFPFIFSPISLGIQMNDFQRLIYYCWFIVVFQFGWAAVQISHLSLVPDLTPHDHERMELYNMRYLFTVAANVFVYILLWVLFERAGVDQKLGPDDASKFQIVAWTVTILGSVLSILFHIFVKEKQVESYDEATNLVDQNYSQPCRSLFSALKLYITAVIYMCTRLFCNMSQVYIPNYLHHDLKLSSVSLAVMPLIMFISSFLTSIIMKPLAAAFGKHVTYLIGAGIGFLAAIWVYFGKSSDPFYQHIEIYGTVVAFGVASAILLVTSLSITADLIGSNIHCGSLIYGFMSLIDKISNGAAVLAAEHLRKIYSLNVTDRDVLVVISSSSTIIAILFVCILLSKYRITGRSFTPLSSRDSVTVSLNSNEE